MIAARGPYVGRRIKRTEDPRLIRGLGHYVDDLLSLTSTTCPFCGRRTRTRESRPSTSLRRARPTA